MMTDWIEYERARLRREAEVRAGTLDVDGDRYPRPAALPPALPPIVPQAELDRRAALAAYRRSYRTAAAATFCGVTCTVLLIWLDPIKWFL